MTKYIKDNILVDVGPRAMICDFGQSAVDEINGPAASNAGSVTYVSPEMIPYIEGKEYTEERRPLLQKADVYATGLTIYQVLLILYLVYPLFNVLNSLIR